MKSRVASLFLASAFAYAAAASAQLRSGTVEINPFGGWLFGGEISHLNNNFNGDHFDDHTHIDVDDDAAYGGRIGFNFTSLLEIEGEYSRTESQFVLRQTHFDDQNLGDLRVEYFLGYATFNFGHGRVVPFFTIGAGGANLTPKLPGTISDSETRFMTAAGGVLMDFLKPHFALRFDGKA